jgi:hypothetical protein
LEAIAHCTKSHSLQFALWARTVDVTGENAATAFMKMNAI